MVVRWHLEKWKSNLPMRIDIRTRRCPFELLKFETAKSARADSSSSPACIPFAGFPDSGPSPVCYSLNARFSKYFEFIDYRFSPNSSFEKLMKNTEIMYNTQTTNETKEREREIKTHLC